MDPLSVQSMNFQSQVSACSREMIECLPKAIANPDLVRFYELMKKSFENMIKIFISLNNQIRTNQSEIHKKEGDSGDNMEVVDGAIERLGEEFQKAYGQFNEFKAQICHFGKER